MESFYDAIAWKRYNKVKIVGKAKELPQYNIPQVLGSLNMPETPDERLVTIIGTCGRQLSCQLISTSEFTNKLLDLFADADRVYADIIPTLWELTPESARSHFVAALRGATVSEFRYHAFEIGGSRGLTEEERLFQQLRNGRRVQAWAVELLRFSDSKPVGNTMDSTGAKSERKYLAFDIETAKDVPGDFSEWRKHRPLGIICAATCASDAEPRLWHSKMPDDKHAPQMTQADVQQLVCYLTIMATQGYTILTWNGASFDFDVLAEESGSCDECRTCAHDHVDLMFHLVCWLGFGVKLDRAALGFGLPGKAGGMCGGEAPKLWAAGEYEKVLTYVAQDVRLALQIVAESERRKEFAWITSKGTRSSKPLVGGWKTVREAMQFPLPDTSWMTGKGLCREDCLAWMKNL